MSEFDDYDVDESVYDAVEKQSTGSRLADVMEAVRSRLGLLGEQTS